MQFINHLQLWTIFIVCASAQAPAPQTPGQAPQTPGQSPQTPGQSPQIPGQSPQTPGQSPQTPGPLPQTPRQSPQTPRQSPQTPGQSPQTPGQSPVPQTPGQAPVPQTPGQAPVPQTPGQAPVPQTPGQAPVPQVPLRKTYMCDCADPRRSGGSVPQKPTDDIPELSPTPTNPADPLRSCFEFKLASCPGSLSGEKLGGIFAQKPCAGQPDVRTVDVSFMALNENGYPYGELEVNQLVRPCLGSAVTSYQTVIHDQKPVQYSCPGFLATLTLYGKDPKWLSVEADFQVAAGEKPRAIQVMLKEKIKTGASFPSHIQLVAEFSVELKPGGSKEFRRIMTERRQLAFNAGGEVDFAATKVQTPPITPHVNYLGRPLTCSTPTACKNCGSLDPNDFLCRKLDAESDPSVSQSDAIEKCIKTAFNFPGKGAEFFASLEMDSAAAPCSGFKIIQSVFMVLERGVAGVRVAGGSWDKAQSGDLKNCQGSRSTATGLSASLKYSIDSCDPKAQTKDNQLYHHYREVDKLLVCGKWKSSSTIPTPRDIQAGIKIYYTDGSKKFIHVHRIPDVYELSGSTLDKVIDSPNKRTDILWAAPPPNIKTAPAITLPVFRKTYMCKCTSPRRSGGSIRHDPNADIPNLSPTPTNPTDPLRSCFQFKLARCPSALTSEKLGALFIQQPCTGQPNMRTVDIAFVALNENGYPYGELEVNRLVRPCFTDVAGPTGVTSYQPVIHDLKPVDYACSGFSASMTLYGKDPKWLSVEADLEVPAGENPRVIQVMLKEKVKTGSSYPSHIQFVAEFSVELSPGTSETRRIMTERRKLAFSSGGEVDFAATTVQTPEITPHVDYLTEVGTLSCSGPRACSNCPSLDPNVFLCRKIEADNDPSVTQSDAIEQCLKMTFNFPGKGAEFFASMEMDSSAAPCSGFTIKQSVFMVLERGVAGVHVADGSWDKVQSGDLKNCQGSSSKATGLSASLKYSIDSCNPSAKDNQLYHHYREVDDRLVCGKWKSSSTIPTPREIQAGIKIYYSDGGKEFVHVHRIPDVYELIASSLEKVVNGPNKRTDILWATPPQNIMTAPAIAIPLLRKTYMCKCTSPRRSGGSIRHDPNADILNLSPTPTNPTDPLRSCFQFKLATCPSALTDEKLGALFIQEPCTGQPNIRTVDITFVALNENGYPYGELEVNRLVRPCFTDVAGPTGVTSYQPVIHDLKPVDYVCPGLSASTTLYGKDPKWLSVEADLEVASGENPRVIQVMLKEKIKSGASYPSHIQFVAEFSVELSPGTSETRRIMTERRKLAFSSGGEVDFAATTVQTPEITPHVDYLTEVGTLSCSGPRACSNCPSLDRNVFLCRKIDADNDPSVTQSDAIEQCLKTAFNYHGTGTELFASLEMDSSAAPCSGFTIKQNVFMVLERDAAGVGVADGKWDKVQSGDLRNCQGISSTAFGLSPSLKYSIDSCDLKGQTKDNQLYHNYREVDDLLVCGKWHTNKVMPTPREIQAGIKIYYTDGSKEFVHVHRIPDIYEIIGLTVEKVVGDPNKRTDILLAKPPPTFATSPPIPLPRFRKTHMCNCANPRRSGGSAPHDPNADIPNLSSTPTNPADKLLGCFKFKMVSCPSSITGEKLGALFIQLPCTGEPNARTVDIAFVALNENGYPYGELEVNRLVRPCFTDVTGPDGVTSYQPVIHNLKPVEYECPGFSASMTLYGKDPKWLSVEADTKVASGENPRVIQVMFKDKIKSGSPYPSHIQFVAEFSVELSPGTIETRRIMTERRQLAFGSGGEVDFAATAVQTPDIAPDLDYLTEGKTLTCSAPTACTNCPSLNRNLFLCRQIEADNDASVKPSNAIAACLKPSFNYPSGSGTEFFISLEMDKTPTCSSLIIEQSVFMVLERDAKGVRVSGSWERVQSTDFADCQGPNSAATGLQKPLKYNVDSCDPKVRDKQLFHNYKDVADLLICGKWKSVGSSLREIQAGIKLYYTDGKNHFIYVHRIPDIYEVSGSTVEKVIIDPNNRTDILWNTPPSLPVLILPFIPTSDICDCTAKRHGGFNQIPEKTFAQDISLANPPIPLDCFEFKIVPCSIGGDDMDTIGALLIIKTPTSTPACTADIIVEDASFVVLNGRGFPFGEPKFKEFLRVCLLPADLLQYEIKNINFARPVTGVCDNRLRDDGTPFDIEHEYAGMLPSWLQVAVGAEIPLLEKPVAIQVYLDKPPGGTSATEVQFITEMVIRDIPTGKKEIYRLKSPVYDIGYDSSKKHYDASALVENTAKTEIPRNDDWYETIDTSQRVCHGPLVPSVQNKPYDIQQCGCFTFTDQKPPKGGTRLDATAPSYIDKVSKCIFYEWAVNVEKKDVNFYFTVWTKTTADEAVCGDFQVIGMSLTPLIRKLDAASKEQIGVPFGDWIQTTLAAPGFTITSPDPHFEKGLHCNSGTYTGKLRRPPFNQKETLHPCTKPKTLTAKNLFVFHYPMMNQDDGANGFCSGLKIGELGKALDRFEFQIIGYLMMDFTAPAGKYFALKRSFVFEYLEKAVPAPAAPGAPPPPPPGITFPGRVFEVQEGNQFPRNCFTDICLYK